MAEIFNTNYGPGTVHIELGVYAALGINPSISGLWGSLRDPGRGCGGQRNIQGTQLFANQVAVLGCTSRMSALPQSTLNSRLECTVPRREWGLSGALVCYTCLHISSAPGKTRPGLPHAHT